MATAFDDDTAAVIDSFANCRIDRLKSALTSFVQHLHDFVRDVEPNQAEWERGIQFLTDVGLMCVDAGGVHPAVRRVGVSMLVDAINNRKPPGATESTVLGRSTSSNRRGVSRAPTSPPETLSAVVRGTVRSVGHTGSIFLLPGAVVTCGRPMICSGSRIQFESHRPSRP